MLLILKFSQSKVCQDVYEKWENWSFRIKYIESCVKYCRSTSAPNLVCRRIPISNLSPPREILSFRGSILVAGHHHHDQCVQLYVYTKKGQNLRPLSVSLVHPVHFLGFFSQRPLKLCHLAILDGRTGSKVGEDGQHASYFKYF